MKQWSGVCFGHAVFYAEAVEAARVADITMSGKGRERRYVCLWAADELEKGLIENIMPFIPGRFYNYDKDTGNLWIQPTSMTSREILQKLSEKPREKAEESGMIRAQKQHKRRRSEYWKIKGDQQKRQSDNLQTEEADTADPAKSTLSSGRPRQMHTHSLFWGEDEGKEGMIEDVTGTDKIIVK